MDEDPMEYVNFQAFLAHFDATSPGNSDSLYALWAMRKAFEESHEEDGPAVRDIYIMGAAQWILRDGQRLFNSRASVGLKKGQVTRKQWQSWKIKFGDVAGSSDAIGKECKTVALNAAETMDALER